MIIRSNLASVPVKNYSLFFLGCLVLTIVAVMFTVLNVTSLNSWVVESEKLEANKGIRQAKLQELQRQSQDLQMKISRIKTPQFVKETDFINNAIKRRVFSWTTLFDQFEQALPQNVKMVSVFPNIKDEKIFIDMEVAGKSLNDIVELIRVLVNSPAFSDVTWKGERRETEGLLRASISLRYLPEKVLIVAPPEETMSDSSAASPEENPVEEDQ